MNPVYEYHEYGPPTLIGYRVSEKAHVTVPELRNGGKAITAAVNAGGNNVKASNIRLEISNPDAVLKEAREAAVEEATTKAEEYAAATGQTLGDVAQPARGEPGDRRDQSYSYLAAADARVPQGGEGSADPGRRGRAEGHRGHRLGVQLTGRSGRGSAGWLDASPRV